MTLNQLLEQIICAREAKYEIESKTISDKVDIMLMDDEIDEIEKLIGLIEKYKDFCGGSTI